MFLSPEPHKRMYIRLRDSWEFLVLLFECSFKPNFNEICFSLQLSGKVRRSKTRVTGKYNKQGHH